MPGRQSFVHTPTPHPPTTAPPRRSDLPVRKERPDLGGLLEWSHPFLVKSVLPLHPHLSCNGRSHPPFLGVRSGGAALIAKQGQPLELWEGRGRG